MYTFICVLHLYISLVVSYSMPRYKLKEQRMVYTLRLKPEIWQAMTEVKDARKKIELFCEGLVAIDRKQKIESGKLDSQISLDDRLAYHKKFFSENSVKRTNDILQTNEDSLNNLGEN